MSISTSGRTAADRSAYAPLIAYTLKGLDNCWLPEHQRWSHCYHLDGRAEPNESIPHSDVFYSLNVLLGMSRLQDRDKAGYDIKAIFDGCTAQLPLLPVRKYAYGMALWASAELGLEIAPAVEDEIFRFIEDRRNWSGLKAQDIGMILTGLACRIAGGRDRGRSTIQPLFDYMVDHFASSSGLFYDAAQGMRRNFASFATQTYLTIACYNCHAVLQDARPLALANACAGRLISLQGPNGEWPWFYFVPTGKVVDFYEVYSVHQDGMAPAFLEHAERHGVPGARQAIVRGFEWILGKNQLGRSMLWNDVNMICRSHMRKGEHTNKLPRVLRSALHSITGPSQTLIDPAGLTLRLECRSYHLGWVLWAFGKRQDLPMLTHHEAFVGRSPAAAQSSAA